MNKWKIFVMPESAPERPSVEFSKDDNYEREVCIDKVFFERVSFGLLAGEPIIF
jgi:hypothetical protein